VLKQQEEDQVQQIEEEMQDKEEQGRRWEE